MHHRLDEASVGPGIPKARLKGKHSKAGRNAEGQITVRRRGGGHKRTLRQVNLSYATPGVSRVVGVHYDPNRSAYLSLREDAQGGLSYIVAVEGQKVGSVVVTRDPRGAEIVRDTGNRMPLSEVYTGQPICLVEAKRGGGAHWARTAGSFATLVGSRQGGYLVLLPSGEMRLLPGGCYATLGRVSGRQHNRKTVGKAGRSRWRGRRPKVRGVAMNPVDHPHGGGEGKTSGGRPSVTPWGRPTKGQPTSRTKAKRQLRLKGSL